MAKCKVNNMEINLLGDRNEKNSSKRITNKHTPGAWDSWATDKRLHD